MDWQHLIMNGENLAEYAALLAAEGLLGHQHANSGWGTFDDDNMVGATAFMETLELAVELRRAGYGEHGERLGFDLYPYTEDAVGAVKRSVLQWRFIDGIAAQDRRDRAAARPNRPRTPSAPTSSSTPRSVPETLVGLDVGTSGVKGVAIDEEGHVLATASADYPLSRPHPGWSEQEPEDWWRAAGDVLGRLPDGPVGLSGQMHGLVVLDAEQRVLRPAILWNDQRTAAECAEIEERVGFARLVELTGNRALTGFTAPKLLWLRRHEPQMYGRISHVLLPKDYVRLRLTGELADRRLRTPPEHSSSTSAGAPGRRRCARRSRSRSNGSRPRTSRPRSPAPATRRRPRSGSGSRAPGRSRSSSAPPASSSRRSLPTNTTALGDCMRSATPSPTRGTRWA